MNSTQIKCFLALAETLNFTKAAARLYLTQPGLSRQINSLEQELNTQLFIRDPKRVRLTPAGALLASELGPIQDATEQLVARVRTVGQGFTGELSVGLLEGQWMGDSLSDLFRDFMEAYPNIDLRICQGSFGDLRSQLIAGKIDIAFTLGFDLDGVTDIHAAYDILKGWQAIKGDVPATTMAFGTPDDVREYIEGLIPMAMNGGFIIGSGCEIP